MDGCEEEITSKAMKMSDKRYPINCVNGSCDIRGAAVSHSRVGVCGQAPPGRHPATAHKEGRHQEEEARTQTGRRRKWTTEENKMLMECCYRSEPANRGYRQRLHQLWRTAGMKEASDQVRTVGSQN